MKIEGIVPYDLQVHDLSIECARGEVYQRIVHLQEVPYKVENLYYKNLSNSINSTVFIFNEYGNGIMMFAHEY